jgi:hypothetical protein
MYPEDSRRPDAPPVKGLPPVTPPSGKFIAQLFLVPLAIVGGIALVFLAIVWLFGDVLGGLGGPRTPVQFLDKLDKSNPDVRWRAAADLAQTLLRDDQLASNPRFALDLAERLRKTMDAAAAGDKAVADRLSKHPHLAERLSRLVQNQPDPERDPSDADWKALEDDWKKLEPDLNYVMYLSACLGNFAVPAGVPLLNEQALKEPLDVNIAVTLQRRRAVWALANLGENLRRFDQLPPERQAAVLAELEEEVSGKQAERSRLAQMMHDYLKDRQAGKRGTLGADVALERCAQDDQDPFLRELAGFALGFWEGTPDENKRMNQALLRLTSDPGTGNETLAKLFDSRGDKDKDSVPITKRSGSRIHYNATVALARRGADGDYVSRLEEMLDEEEQLKNHRLQRPNGKEDPDEATAYLTVLSALKAVAELQARRPEMLANRPALAVAVAKLKESKNAAVRAEAERTRIVLGQAK